eukprot:GSMAST32.ASY1.ANO1.581.1 assembled CDS
MASVEKQGALNVQRRTWDKEEYAKKAKERESSKKSGSNSIFVAAAEGLPKPAGSTRAYLQPRKHAVDVEKNLNKSLLVNANTPIMKGGGFWCPVCECLLHDSHFWLCHINGRRHQRKLGFTMRTERSTVESVRERFKHHAKRKREEEEIKKNPKKKVTLSDIDEKQRLRLQEREKLRRQKKEEKKRKKAAEKAAKDELKNIGGKDDEEMMKMMGFGTFGGSKKS